MSVPTGTAVPSTAGRLRARRVSGLRRACFAAFVMLVIQFALGSHVNLYVTVPSADPGHGIGQAIANGPAGLTLHIVLGLLLILAALGFLVQAILARQPALIAAAVLGLLAMIGAAASGSAFTGSGRDGASMAMALLAAVGLLCYGAGLFLLRGRRPGVMTADRALPLLRLLRSARRYRGFLSSDGRAGGAAAEVNRPRVADVLLAAVVTAAQPLIVRASATWHPRAAPTGWVHLVLGAALTFRRRH